MTAGTIEAAREGRGNGEGLRESPPTASEQGVSGNITARKRLDAFSSEQEECLSVSGSAVESSEGLAAVVSQGLSGESRSKGIQQ